MNHEEGVFVVKAIIFLVLAVSVILAAQCNPELPGETKTTEAGIEYKYFTVDGMPCIYVTEGVGKYATGGPTCDWSKYRGR